MDIKPMLLARKRADSSFQYVRDAKSGQYYLRDQVIFWYDSKTSPDAIRKSVDYYVGMANEMSAKTVKYKVNRVNISSNGMAIVTGTRLSDIVAKGGTVKPPPPPPPIIPSDRILLNRIHPGIAMINNQEASLQPVLIFDSSLDIQ